MLSPKAKALGESIGKIRRNQQKVLTDVLAITRNLIPVLRDHNMPSMADELARQIHLYDCEVEESTKLLLADDGLEAMIELLTASADGNGGR